jgi:hypothetical protein
MCVPVGMVQATKPRDSFRCAALIFLFVLLAIVCPACQADPPLLPLSFDARVVSVEPPNVAAFVAALAGGDEVAAEEIALPLYRDEMVRRGLIPVKHLALNPGTPAIAFTFAGGVRDDGGFGHFLYVASAPAPGHPQPTSPAVWRVDTDPYGEVIWAEEVYSFASGSVVTAAVEEISLGKFPEFAALRPFHPVALVQIHSDTTRESYDAIELDDPVQSTGMSVEGKMLAFCSVDERGLVHPGGWSYGQTDSAVLSGQFWGGPGQ